MSTNKAFCARAIRKAQHLAIDDPFCQALHEYIVRSAKIAWDDARALFWVECPESGWRVAVWMMPAALHFEPRDAA